MSRPWTFSEEKILIDNYATCTVFELMEQLPGRDEDSINCKIKRMRKPTLRPIFNRVCFVLFLSRSDCILAFN